MDVLVGSPPLLVLLGVLVGLLVAAIVYAVVRSRRNNFATPLEKATFGTLHTVALAAPALREGLSPSSAAAVSHAPSVTVRVVAGAGSDVPIPDCARFEDVLAGKIDADAAKTFSKTTSGLKYRILRKGGR